MSKRARQYIGILAAGVVYYLVHEGAHLLYALFAGVFKQINFLVILKVFIGFRTTLASFTVLHLFSAAFANCFFGSVFIRISVYATVIAIRTAIWISCPCMATSASLANVSSVLIAE